VVNPSSVQGQVALPSQSFGCVTPTSATAHALVFEITQTSDMAAFVSHGGVTLPEELQLRQGCDMSSTLLLSADYDCRTHGTVLSPGVYTFVDCNDYWGTGHIEPPPPIGSNTSCARAIPLPYSEPYDIFDTSPRYYSFKVTNNPSQACYLDVFNLSNINAGSYTIEIQSQCGVGTTPYNETVCGLGTATPNLPTNSIQIPLLANGNYWLELSSIDPGLKLGFSIRCL
jgi:hypothetical protein